MIVVYCLDERLDLAALGLSSLGHTSSNLRRVTFDARNKGVGKRVGFTTRVEGLDNNDLGQSPYQLHLTRRKRLRRRVCVSR